MCTVSVSSPDIPIMKIDRGQIQFREYVSTGTEPKIMQMVDKAASVERGEENNNDTKKMEPPASFRSGVWKHFGFRVNVHNGKEVVENEKTASFVITIDVCYKSGNTSNMSTHLKRLSIITSGKEADCVCY